jgi:hypothetical protein
VRCPAGASSLVAIVTQRAQGSYRARVHTRIPCALHDTTPSARNWAFWRCGQLSGSLQDAAGCVRTRRAPQQAGREGACKVRRHVRVGSTWPVYMVRGHVYHHAGNGIAWYLLHSAYCMAVSTFALRAMRVHGSNTRSHHLAHPLTLGEADAFERHHVREDASDLGVDPGVPFPFPLFSVVMPRTWQPVLHTTVAIVGLLGTHTFIASWWLSNAELGWLGRRRRNKQAPNTPYGWVDAFRIWSIPAAHLHDVVLHPPKETALHEGLEPNAGAKEFQARLLPVRHPLTAAPPAAGGARNHGCCCAHRASGTRGADGRPLAHRGKQHL